MSYTLLLENMGSSHPLDGCGLLGLGCIAGPRDTVCYVLGESIDTVHLCTGGAMWWKRDQCSHEGGIQQSQSGEVPSRERQQVQLGTGVGQWGLMMLESSDGQFSPLAT